MVKRKKIPKEIEQEVLHRSRRRCCLCFGLNHVFSETDQRGQIAHLDRDPSNYDFDNLAWLCLDHHDQYDSRTSQSKRLTVEEVKEYREKLYEAVAERDRDSWPVRLDVPLLDVPLLNFYRRIASKRGIPREGIQLTDKDVESGNEIPLLYLSIYFKESRYFRDYISDENEKWLYIEANIRPAFTFRIQVRAWNNRDVYEFMDFFSDVRDSWSLSGPQSGEYSQDYLRVWRENGENKLMMAAFTETGAGISISARFSSEVAEALACYLKEIGFAKPFRRLRK